MDTLPTYHLDFETYSEVDLTEVGAHRYAQHPTTEVLMFAVSKDDGPVYLWVAPRWRGLPGVKHDPEAQGLMKEIANPEPKRVIAHNAQFEHCICRYTLGLDIPYTHWVCSAVMARMVSIPHSLAKAAAFLELNEQKDSKGEALKRLFCMLNGGTAKKPETFRVLPSDKPDKFAAFCDYCRQDVATERALAHALQNIWPATSESLLVQAYHADMRINDTGFPVDLPTLEHTQRIIDSVSESNTQEFEQIVGLKPTQTVKVLAWFKASGYLRDNMQAATVEEVLAKPPGTMTPSALRALQLKGESSFAAVKKVTAMLRSAGLDGRVRGSLFFHGATTGRWSSKLVQQQNLKRSTKTSLKVYERLQYGASLEAIELCFGPPLEAIASAIRHFITHPFCELMAVDYGAIECRIVNWIAGQDDMVTAFREFDRGRGEEPYRIMAGKIFNMHPAQVQKDSVERFVGKQAVLGCGYSMGSSKFQATCANYGQKVSDELANQAVSAYREAHPKVVSFWYAVERTCKKAINHPGNRFELSGGRIKIFTATVSRKRFLFIRLPSGRHLSYPEPEIDRDEQITFYGCPPTSQVWCRISTYGGRLVENIVQGIAADCMSSGLVEAVKGGYEVCMLVHDECVAVKHPHHTLEGFTEKLLTMPPWASDLPLVADGKTMKNYSK